MIKCGPECPVVCDFCRHYDFNGEEAVGLDGSRATAYTGNGRCRLRDEPREPEENCDDFHCTHAKDMKRV